MHQQATMAQMQVVQESQRLRAEVESMLCEQLGVVQEETMQNLGIVAQDLM